MTELGTRIKRLREARKWSQSDLAVLVGVTVRTVGNWENGKYEPRNKLGALESVFETDLTTGTALDGDDRVYRAVRASDLSRAGQLELLSAYERLRDSEGIAATLPGA